MSTDLSPERHPGKRSIVALSLAVASVIVAMALVPIDRMDFGSVGLPPAGDGAPAAAEGAWVSADFDRVLGVGPALEGPFVPEDENGRW